MRTTMMPETKPDMAASLSQVSLGGFSTFFLSSAISARRLSRLGWRGDSLGGAINGGGVIAGGLVSAASSGAPLAMKALTRITTAASRILIRSSQAWAI